MRFRRVISGAVALAAGAAVGYSAVRLAEPASGYRAPAWPTDLNEDGLRERPRYVVLKARRRVLLLGGALVGGVGLSREQSLAFALASRFPGVYFVNAGLADGDNEALASRLARLAPLYQPEAVLWIAEGACDQAGALKEAAAGVHLRVLAVAYSASSRECLARTGMETVALPERLPAGPDGAAEEVVFLEQAVTPRLEKWLSRPGKP